MGGEKRCRRTVAEIKREAIGEVLTYLAYRATVCRQGLAQYEASHGETSRAAATERSATFEAELIERDVRTILAAQGDRGERGRELRSNLAKWTGYVSQAPTPNLKREGQP